MIWLVPAVLFYLCHGLLFMILVVSWDEAASPPHERIGWSRWLLCALWPLCTIAIVVIVVANFPRYIKETHL